MRFTISRSSDQQYYFEIQSGGNYETLATSETYRTKEAAEEAVKKIKDEAAAAEVVDRA